MTKRGRPRKIESTSGRKNTQTRKGGTGVATAAHAQADPGNRRDDCQGRAHAAGT